MIHYKDLEKKLLAMGHDEQTARAVVSAMVSVDKYGLSEDQKYAVYSLMSVEGFAALRGLPDAVAFGTWTKFDWGNMRDGDYVRVKKDAYTAPSGVNHNGKIGRIANLYGGRCRVDYIGLDTGSAMTHPVGFLESLKRV